MASERVRSRIPPGSCPYRVWARRHPARAGVQLNRSAQRKAKPKGTKPKGSNWSVEDLGGGAAIVAVLGLGVVLSCSFDIRVCVLAVVAVLNIVGELSSFTKIIDAVPPLRALDRAGRRDP